MMTYNPPYYERLIENYGFRKTQDLYAFWGHIDMLPKIATKLKPIAEQIIERYNVHVRTLDKKHFLRDVEMFLSIYNRSLGNTWGFVPMSPDEMRHVAAGLRYMIVPEMAIAAEVDGQMVGAAFGLPDYNPRIKEIDGRLFPFGFIHLLRNPQGDQTHPADQHQRAARISTSGLRPGVDARPGAQGLGMGPGRRRVLLGAGIQLPELRRAEKRRRQDHQDLPALRSGRTWTGPRTDAASSERPQAPKERLVVGLPHGIAPPPRPPEPLRPLGAAGHEALGIEWADGREHQGPLEVARGPQRAAT